MELIITILGYIAYGGMMILVGVVFPIYFLACLYTYLIKPIISLFRKK